MWIGAHPDDESMVSGALLAKACAVDGASCTVVAFEDGRLGRCNANSIAQHQRYHMGVVNLSIMRRQWNANSALAFCSSVSEEV